MHFVASITISAGSLSRMIQAWDACGDPRPLFASVMVTPLFARGSTLDVIRTQLKDKRGSRVYFDSGGYYVQQSRIDYWELWDRLRSYYRDPRNQWADWYVLPDSAPNSSDAADIVEEKVIDTVKGSLRFLATLPTSLQERAIPVVQGQTHEQVNYCVENYSGCGLKYIGFGSFATSGTNHSISCITRNCAACIEQLGVQSRHLGTHIHIFGVSTLPLIHMYQSNGFHSFDSSAWMRAAGFGNVFLPLTRGYLITQRIVGRGYLTAERFRELKSLTGHECAFCQRFEQLQNDRMSRVLHNAACVLDTVKLCENESTERLLEIVQVASPAYVRYY